MANSSLETSGRRRRVSALLSKLDPGRRRLLCAGLLALLSCAQYAYTIGNPLIWDARIAVLRDPSIRSISEIPGFFRSGELPPAAYGEGAVARLPYYRPLMRTLKALEYAAFGGDATGYHAVNVLLGAAVVAVFFAMLHALCGDPKLAFGASLLYAVNPARGEAVYWVYGASNQLMALLVCAALLFYRRRRHLPAMAAFAAGLLVREDTVLLPLALLLYEICCGEGEPRARVLRTAPYFAAALGFVALRSVVLGGFPPITAGVGALATANTAAVIVQRFFALAIAPSDPVGVFPREVFDSLTTEVALSYAVVAAYLAALFVAWRRRRALAFWLAWALLWISLWFNVGQFGDYLMTEKGMYLASGGLCVAAAALLLRLHPNLAHTGLALIACIHFAVTFTRSTYWADPVLFFEHAVSAAPDFPPTRYALGLRYADRGEFSQAASQFERVIEIAPSHSLALNNLGNCYYALEDADRAALFWGRALAADASNASAAFNLGFAAERTGDMEGALDYYGRYLALTPDPPAAIAQHIRELKRRGR